VSPSRQPVFGELSRCVEREEKQPTDLPCGHSTKAPGAVWSEFGMPQQGKAANNEEEMTEIMLLESDVKKMFRSS